MNVTTLAIAALVVMVALAGTYIQGRSDGGNLERAETLARDIQQAAENAAFAQKIQEGRRAKEREWAGALSAVSTDYQARLTNAEGKTALALNAIRSGSIRLRDPFAKPEACGDPSGTATTAASGRNGSARGELSGALAEYLVSLATEADRNTLQLTACQAALLADRK